MQIPDNFIQCRGKRAVDIEEQPICRSDRQYLSQIQDNSLELLRGANPANLRFQLRCRADGLEAHKHLLLVEPAGGCQGRARVARESREDRRRSHREWQLRRRWPVLDRGGRRRR